MNKKINVILTILLLIELVLGNVYLLGFYRGMEECKKIYVREGLNNE